MVHMIHMVFHDSGHNILLGTAATMGHRTKAPDCGRKPISHCDTPSLCWLQAYTLRQRLRRSVEELRQRSVH